MKGKNLLILVVLAAILVGLTVMTSKKEARKAAPSDIGRKFLADLPVNDIETIMITDSGSKLTLARTGDEWTSPDKYGHPVDFQKVKDALIKLTVIKIGQVVQLTPKQKNDLRLSAPQPGSTNRTGTVVDLLGAGNRKIASLLIGDSRSRKGGNDPMGMGGGYPDGQYLSIDNGATAYLVADSLGEFTTASRDWMTTEILNVPPEGLSKATIIAPDGTKFPLERANQSTYLLPVVRDQANDDIDQGKTFGIDSALSYLRFSDIADPALTEAQMGFDKPAKFVGETWGGQIFTVLIGSTVSSNKTDRYVRASVVMAPAPAVDTNATTSASSTNSPAAKAAIARKQLEMDTADLTKKLAKWTYIVESYKTESMMYTHDQVVKKKEVSKPAGENTPATIPAPAPAPDATEPDEKK